LGREGEKACNEGDGNFQLAKSKIQDKKEQHCPCIYDWNNNETLPTAFASRTVLMNVVFKRVSAKLHNMLCVFIPLPSTPSFKFTFDFKQAYTRYKT